MKRREFIQSLAGTAAGLAFANPAAAFVTPSSSEASSISTLDGHTLVAEFKVNAASWKVYEDLRTRDGDITFVSAQGASIVLPKSAEAAFAEANPPHLGFSMDEIGLSGPDLLADKLLADGDDPDPVRVKSAAPPQGAPPPRTQSHSGHQQEFQQQARWDTFVGTMECADTMPVYPSGNTRTYHPGQLFGEISGNAVRRRFDGLVGSWMPAVRKVFPVSDTAYIEVIVFGDVEAKDRFIVQTWHRTSRVEDGKIKKVVYGYSFPEYPPARLDPKPEAFYRALLSFAGYWDKLLESFARTSLPDSSWVDISKHAFAKELMVRPGGVYPKYGAVDRDYYGPEYDGFQDIFTMSAYANLECGRFDEARAIIDNYFSDFVDARGVNNMRGPETAQFGLTLALMARYFNYTRDAALIEKHKPKILATAKMLEEMHDESLKLPKDDIGYGLIHGWSESDACLAANPSMWWLPYFANNAFAARGLQDLARIWASVDHSAANQIQHWVKRAKVLREATIASIEKDMWRDRKPSYIGTYPGTKIMFRESLGTERPSPQQWAHRPYSELLQADILPEKLANGVIDCMRAYGATTIGVVANVGAAKPGARAILGFISYGYAQMLLRLDRVEEYLLFLYSHRYHDHTRGSWVAGEVSEIDGETALFCIPAQQTIPLLVRWMLVLEDSDEDRLYFARGVPRQWVASGRPVQIEKAPTRWGRVSLNLASKPASKSVVATVQLAHPGAPKEIHVKLRTPRDTLVKSATVNGSPANLGGRFHDTVIVQTGNETHFEVVGQLG